MKWFLRLLLGILVTTLKATTYNYSNGVIATDDVSASQLAAAIQGTGITISNPKITHGSGKQVGIFYNGNLAGLEIDSGIILTGMNVYESFTSNNNGNTSIEESGTYSDPDLTAIDSKAIYNPIIFEFDVTLDENTRLLLIDYQFASEEYNEYVGSQFNDAFGFFISGGDLNTTYNIARVVDNNTYVTVENLVNYAPVTVNNVNNGSVGIYDDATPEILTNTAYYINNCNKDTGDPNCDQKNPPIEVEYDGLTHTLHATLDNLTPGQTYHFKLAIADTGDAYWDTGVFIHKINGLREPSLCYDYAYKQYGVYFTEEYNSSKGPRVVGSVIANDPNAPVDVSMYLKNTKESDIVVSNVTFNIIDLNTSQVTYHPQSVYVLQPGEAFKTHIDDAVLSVADSYIQNIPIDSFDAFEYFYTYFSLDPKVSKLDFPLYAKIDYDLTIPLSANDSLTVHRTSMIDADVPLCTGGEFTYAPAKGIFNVVNANYANPSLSTGYYNDLPTQVTNRVGDFKVLSLDPDNLDQPKPVSTIVAVDMIDASAFHDTNASCQELSSAISDRIWILFDGNTTETNFNSLSGVPSSFFTQARQNAAFRVSYNVMNKDGELLYVQKENDGTYTILNWRTEWNGEYCTQDMDGNPSNLDAIASYCNDTGNNPNSLAICMECIFGLDTRVVCSRDNFSIRPEALSLHLKDSNSSSGTINIPVDGSIQNVAAGYNYDLEVNATSYTNDLPSPGYYTGLDINYKWNPSTGIITSGCNDTNDKNESINFTNGSAAKTIHIDQVGEYKLTLLDQSWTKVDSDPAFMTHQSGPYFHPGVDCTLGSSNVVLQGTSGLNGCEISSYHYNPNLTKQYYDYLLDIRPYKFDLTTINASVGEGNDNPSIKDFVYMANIDRNVSGSYPDINMSYHIYGDIVAKGQNNTTLTNFVNNCYAKDLQINFPRTAYADTTLTFKNSFEAVDANETALVAPTFKVVNNSDYNVDVAKVSFDSNLSGHAKVRVRYNFSRDINDSKNPQLITFQTFSVDCKNTSECQAIADSSSTHTPLSSKGINNSIKFYYARAHAPKMVTNGQDGNASIFYEVYCYGSGCNQALLQDGTASQNSDDPRWWINTQHTQNFGTISSVVQKRSPAHVSVTAMPTGNHPDQASLHYDGTQGYPYRAIMNIIPDKWLIYNKYNASADHNEFEAQFNADTSDWIGSGETDVSTETIKRGYKDRKLTW